MAGRVSTLTFQGVEIVDVAVQSHLVSGMPAFTIVGLPDKTIAESKERVRAALSSSGLNFPAKKITVNLAPADLIKEGSHFDLAIACCLLISMDILSEIELADYMILGELALDGSIMSVNGVLPTAIGANARNKGIICPKDNGREAAWSGNESILAPDSLIALINHFKGIQVLSRPEPDIIKEPTQMKTLANIKGQTMAKRALEIAACGGHNMLMSGPPGAGKSMLAQHMINILPSMTKEEILECSMISSIAGQLVNGKLQTTRPFRAPHHSCSMPAMVGGGVGRKISPGEISLAHNGVLFLDELPEFPRTVIDSLRQPIESGNILVSRTGYHVTFPAKFQLIAAMNPCRCGYLTDLERNCNRAPKCAIDYQSKISGPILDRIDIHIDVPSLSANDLITANDNAQQEDNITKRVESVRHLQRERYDGLGIRTNSELNGQVLLDFALPNNEGQELLNNAIDKLKLSMRGYNRILRLARTIADMEHASYVNKHHIAEAISYRQILHKK